MPYLQYIQKSQAETHLRIPTKATQGGRMTPDTTFLILPPNWNYDSRTLPHIDQIPTAIQNCTTDPDPQNALSEKEEE